MPTKKLSQLVTLVKDFEALLVRLWCTVKCTLAVVSLILQQWVRDYLTSPIRPNPILVTSGPFFPSFAVGSLVPRAPPVAFPSISWAFCILFIAFGKDGDGEAIENRVGDVFHFCIWPYWIKRQRNVIAQVMLNRLTPDFAFHR